MKIDKCFGRNIGQLLATLQAREIGQFDMFPYPSKHLLFTVDRRNPANIRHVKVVYNKITKHAVVTLFPLHCPAREMQVPARETVAAIKGNLQL